MAANVPRVITDKDRQRFYAAVKEILDVLTGKKAKAVYDRALTVRDLEKLGIDLDKFLNCDKKNPYEL